MEQIGETICVIASFDPAYKFRPLRFLWNRRTIAVKEITYTWKSTEGSAVLWHFSVSGEAALYELSLDLSTMLWRLDNVEAA